MVTIRQYFNNNINNLTFHKLCINYTLPPGTRHILGLGHTFIPQIAFPLLSLHSTFHRFNWNNHQKYIFAVKVPEPQTKNYRRIYVKYVLIPDQGNEDLESRQENFNQQLTTTIIMKRNNVIKLSFNLSRVKHQALYS